MLRWFVADANSSSGSSAPIGGIGVPETPTKMSLAIKSQPERQPHFWVIHGPPAHKPLHTSAGHPYSPPLRRERRPAAHNTP